MIVGLIPARSGSKGIPQKNIKLLGGYPLMAWSIAVSRMSCLIDKTIVSTNSDIYATMASLYGAEYLIRPEELASDDATDYDYINHALQEIPDVTLLVILRPTTPLREAKYIDRAITGFRLNQEATSLRSVCQMSESAMKSLVLVDGWLEGISGTVDFCTRPRQEFAPTYKGDGYIDIIKPEQVKNGRIFGDKTLPFLTENVGEIDNESDFDYIEWRLGKYGSVIYEFLRNSYPL